MTIENLVEFAQHHGAYAHIRYFGTAEPIPTICILVEPTTSHGVQGYKHGIFVNRCATGWILGFSQSGKTRVLNDTEVTVLIRNWIHEPTWTHFVSYEA